MAMLDLIQRKFRALLIVLDLKKPDFGWRE
jgi:hypothetical protein